MRYGDDRVESGLFSIHALPLGPNAMCTIVESVTERKRTEEALRQAVAQEETIRAQMAILDELSTPLIPVNDRVVIMPLIGAVDSRRAQKMTEALLTGITATQARVAISDITGVPVVDTQVANALLQAAQAVQLLGAKVILTGIRPEVAQTSRGHGRRHAGHDHPQHAPERHRLCARAIIVASQMNGERRRAKRPAPPFVLRLDGL